LIQQLAALVARRQELLDFCVAEQNRLGQSTGSISFFVCGSVLSIGLLAEGLLVLAR
jgi:hypothetical protein